MAEGHRVFLIGGDTSSSPGLLSISFTLLALHLARAQGGKIASPDEEYFFEKHLNAMPRVQEGRTLAERGLATAMIDVSDGLFLASCIFARKLGLGQLYGRSGSSNMPLLNHFPQLRHLICKRGS